MVVRRAAVPVVTVGGHRVPRDRRVFDDRGGVGVTEHMASGQWLLVAAVLVACIAGAVLLTYVVEEIRHDEHRREDDDRHA
jgi:hypothetical protein